MAAMMMQRTRMKCTQQFYYSCQYPQVKLGASVCCGSKMFEGRNLRNGKVFRRANEGMKGSIWCGKNGIGRGSTMRRGDHDSVRQVIRKCAAVDAGMKVALKHPLEQLSASEIEGVAAVVKALPGFDECRFNYITLKEPKKRDMIQFYDDDLNPKREALVRVVKQDTFEAFDMIVEISESSFVVTGKSILGSGCNPLLTPDDCSLAEEIVKSDEKLMKMLKERYNLQGTVCELLICDPWSVHLATDDFKTPALEAAVEKANGSSGGVVPRLVQAFLYYRTDEEDNQYAHPLDVLPTVDLNTKAVVHVFVPEGPAPEAPMASVNYHRNKIASNDFLETAFREPPKPLDITQPEGPSFSVDNNYVKWQKWEFCVGFNHREGLVLHDVKYDGRQVLWRASLVEMAVPYGDPNEPFQQKCAFDVGDYGLGYCTDSLKLGCDCLGSIHYFDATLSDSRGAPYIVPQAICMHEEDVGLLWKHVEFRTGHSESRRSRRLVLSFIVTVVNYEYLMYWYLLQDGTIEYEMKLSGELSTNMLSPSERETGIPKYGTLVAPGVNAQIHQHMFCFRLDMAVDGHNNTVHECNVVVGPESETENPYGNAFYAEQTPLKREAEAQRDANVATARTWNITNPVTQTAYKLIPYTRGPAQPPLLTSPSSNVTRKGAFAKKVLWVTPHNDNEYYPAGDCTVQSTRMGDGLPAWTESNRNIENTDIVLWHSFGVVHVPRPEDFPVMPCEYTGFTLKPDGFFKGNPAIDLPPATSSSSKSNCCD